jgi:hypothetical protein
MLEGGGAQLPPAGCAQRHLSEYQNKIAITDYHHGRFRSMTGMYSCNKIHSCKCNATLTACFIDPNLPCLCAAVVHVLSADALVAGQSRAKEVLDLARARPDFNATALTEDEVQAGACHIDRLYAGFLIMSSILFSLPPAQKQLEVYNASSEQMAVIRCDSMPSNASELPYRLKQFCPRVLSPAAISPGAVNLTRGLGTVNCSDPYLAYQQWCSPQYCIEMQEKGMPERATESLAALGGLWSILTAVLFTFAWPAIYASYKQYKQWRRSRPACAGSAGQVLGRLVGLATASAGPRVGPGAGVACGSGNGKPGP